MNGLCEQCYWLLAKVLSEQVALSACLSLKRGALAAPDQIILEGTSKGADGTNRSDSGSHCYVVAAFISDLHSINNTRLNNQSPCPREYIVMQAANPSKKKTYQTPES